MGLASFALEVSQKRSFLTQLGGESPLCEEFCPFWFDTNQRGTLPRSQALPLLLLTTLDSFAACGHHY